VVVDQALSVKFSNCERYPAEAVAVLSAGSVVVPRKVAVPPTSSVAPGVA